LLAGRLIRDMDQAFTLQQPFVRGAGIAWERLTQRFRELFRQSVRRNCPEVISLTDNQSAIGGAAEGVRRLQYRVEHRGKVARRGVDNLQYLSGRGFPLERFVTLGCALGKLTLEIGYPLIGIG